MKRNLVGLVLALVLALIVSACSSASDDDIVVPPPSPTPAVNIDLSRDTVSFPKNRFTQAQVFVAANFAGIPATSLEGMPPGMRIDSYSPTQGCNTSGAEAVVCTETLKLAGDDTLAVGTYNVTVKVIYGGITKTLPLTVQVKPAI
jgi:hypothetical protein